MEVEVVVEVLVIKIGEEMVVMVAIMEAEAAVDVYLEETKIVGVMEVLVVIMEAVEEPVLDAILHHMLGHGIGLVWAMVAEVANSIIMVLLNTLNMVVMVEQECIVLQ